MPLISMGMISILAETTPDLSLAIVYIANPCPISRLLTFPSHCVELSFCQRFTPMPQIMCKGIKTLVVKAGLEILLGCWFSVMIQ